MAKRQVYSFTEKKYSTNSIVSAILSILSVLLMLALLGVSYIRKGATGSWIGAVGVTAIIMAFMGIRYGFAGFQDECKSYFCSKLGTILGTICIISWFLIICLGIARG